MAEQIFPTKGNLIKAKRSLRQAKMGYELMDRKRNILIREMVELTDEAILAGADIHADETLSLHADWVDQLKEKYIFTAENTEEILKQEVGKVFKEVLEDAGVYKCTPEGRTAFMRFVDTVNK